MKKIVLFAAAGMLATAGIVFASVKADKKPETVKKETIKKDVKTNKTIKRHCAHYCMGDV